MKKIHFIFTLSAIAVLAGCYGEKGNDRIVPIGQIEITGIEANYTVLSFEDNLVIRPTVQAEYPDADLEYTWFYYAGGISVDTRIDTIGRQKDLDYPVTMPEGTFNLVLSVRNKTSDYTVTKTTSVSSVTRFSRGFYLLKQTQDGNTDMDLHLEDGAVADNLLVKSLGAPLTGKPTRLGLMINYSFLDRQTGKPVGGNAIAPMSERDMRIMRISDMSLIYDHTEMFFGDQPDEAPYFACRGMLMTYYISSQGCYATRTMPEFGMFSMGKFGYVLTPTGAGPHAVQLAGFNGANGVFYFDPGQRSFLCGDMQGMLHTFSDDGKPATPNNIRDKCLFLGAYSNMAAGVYAFSIFEGTSAQRSLYIMRLMMGNYSNPVVEKRTLAAGSKFSTATMFAANGRDARLIYGVEQNKLYMYNVEDGSEIPCTLEGMGAGETITYMAHKYWVNTADAPYLFNCIVVATQKGNEYKVYMYDILGGQPHGIPVKTFSGTGTVVDMQYCSPKMAADDSNYKI